MLRVCNAKISGTDRGVAQQCLCLCCFSVCAHIVSVDLCVSVCMREFSIISSLSNQSALPSLLHGINANPIPCKRSNATVAGDNMAVSTADDQPV